MSFYDVDKKLLLVDLPGYGFAKRPLAEKEKWSRLTDGYFTNNPNIDRLRCVLQLVDSRIPPTKDDEMMLDYLRQLKIPFVVVATKVDKLNKTERKKNLDALAAHPLTQGAKIIPFSSLSGEGKEELLKVMFSYLG